MNSTLHRNSFFIKEHVGMFKAANNYDILDPESHNVIMNCREENLGFFTKLFRFSNYKRMTPFHIEIKTPSGEKVLTVKRGFTLFLSTVEVFDENDQLVGKFKQTFISMNVLNANDEVVAKLKGKWSMWDFSFVKDDVVLASVSKKWAGLGKELFTSADNYILTIDENVANDDPIRLLVLGAVMCIDMVLKE